MNLKKITPLYTTLLIYGIIVSLIVYIKPRLLFDGEGNIKCTGCGNNKSIFSFPIIVVFISILTYFMVEYIIM